MGNSNRKSGFNSRDEFHHEKEGQQGSQRKDARFPAGGADLDPSVFLTNLPSIIGFQPNGHVVIVATTAQGHNSYYRSISGSIVVKELSAFAEIPELAESVAQVLGRDGHNVADIYIVDGEWGYTIDSSPLVPALWDVGFEQVRLSGTAAVAAGEVITDAGGEIVGIVGDSLLATKARWYQDAPHQAAKSGNPSRESAAGTGLYEPEQRFDPRTLSADETQDLSRLRQRARRTIEPVPYRVGTHNAELIEHFENIVHACAQVASKQARAEELVRSATFGYSLCVALTNLALRDLTLALVAAAAQEPMTQLWLSAAELHPGEVRANALACYAIAQLHQGQPTRGIDALYTVSTEMPEHSLTKLLRIAVINDVVPRCLDTLLDVAGELVAELYHGDQPQMRHG